MNSRPPWARPTITWELCLRVYQEIINHPTIGAMAIMLNLIAEDPINVVYFYSRPIGKTLTLKAIMQIFNCVTIAGRRKLYKELLHDRAGEFALNPAVITRIKHRLNREYAPSTEHGAVYGASNLGYVVESAMTAEYAALWMSSRIAQIQHECFAWITCAQLLGNSGSPERRATAVAARRWVQRSMVHDEIKNITDGLRDNFIRN